MLDEPTASLPADEVVRLFTALRRLRARGVGMIYVSHRLDEVFEIADRMVVLRDGRVAGERRLTRDDAGGDDPADRRPRAVAGFPPAGAARGRGAAVPRRHDASKASARSIARLHAGEVVGLVGLRGAGQESIGRALFGLLPITGGRAMLDGERAHRHLARARPWPPASISSAPTAPASRSCPSLSVRENLFLNPLAAGRGLFSYLAPRRENAGVARARPPGRAAAERSRASRSSSSPAATSRRSSSGAGCISQSKVYVFEDPTAGVDVGAKAEIYRLFDVALQAGAAIIIISTDFEEVAKVCHRALVFDRGRVVAELGAGDLSVENLLAAASARVGRMAATSGSPQQRAAMQSIKSNALEPTRSELAGLPRWQQIVRTAAGLRPADPDGAAHHLLLAAPAATRSRPT